MNGKPNSTIIQESRDLPHPVDIEYIAGVAEKLSGMAKAEGYMFLSYLLDLAAEEAKEISLGAVTAPRRRSN